jgi:hypothetical protein
MLCAPALASAATTPNASSSGSSTTGSAQPVTQGYGTNSPLQKGMIVQLDTKDPTKVDALTTNTIAEMQGVVVAASDAALSLSNNGNSGQVFVATYGEFDVLVSNENGPIKKGDYVTISSIAGVGMKVDTTESTILGKAAGPFSGTSGVVGTAKLTDATGRAVNVSLGLIPVDLSISHNPLAQDATKELPAFLKQASELVTNKPVNPERIYLSLIILFVAAIISGAMLYSGIRGGLIAIGRNPLSKKQIIAGIIRVVLSGLIVFIIGLFSVYLLLKL